MLDSSLHCTAKIWQTTEKPTVKNNDIFTFYNQIGISTSFNSFYSDIHHCLIIFIDLMDNRRRYKDDANNSNNKKMTMLKD